MEGNQLDIPESCSATTNHHLSFPAPADEHSTENIQPAQASERPLHCDKIYVGNLPPEVSMLGILSFYKILNQHLTLGLTFTRPSSDLVT
jgi:hypothetical protein